MAELTDLEDAVVDNRAAATLLIDNYGEKVLFSHPTDRLKPSMAFLSNIPVTKVVERVRRLDADKIKMRETAKGRGNGC